MQKSSLSNVKDQNMTFYPSRWRLLVIIALALLFGFSSLGYLATLSEYFNSSDNAPFLSIRMIIVIFGIVCSILLLIYALLIGVMCLYRIIIPFPSFVVNAEGIYVTPFLLWRGTTRVAWTEIASISFSRVRFKFSPVVVVTWLQSFSCLSITVFPQYEEAVFSRQNRFNKAFFRRGRADILPGISVPQLLLPISGKSLLTQFQIMYRVQIEQFNIGIENEG